MRPSSEHTDLHLLARLLMRGDRVAVHNGRLYIDPKSKEPVPRDWLEERYNGLIAAISRVTQTPVYFYKGFSVGNYRGGRLPGVTLQFESILTGETYYTVFNVITTRKRSTRHGQVGTPLPAGHFRVAPESKFVEFWKRSGLKLPRRLSSIHDYMGLLHSISFTGSIYKGKRLDKDSLVPLEISVQDIAAGLQVENSAHEPREFHARVPDKRRTTAGHVPDNSRTSIPDKLPNKYYKKHIVTGFPGAGHFSRDNKVISNAGTGLPPTGTVMSFSE